MNTMYDRGLITEGFHGSNSCTAIPAWCSSRNSDDRRYHGINPYALGFAMMTGHQAHLRGACTAGRPRLVSAVRLNGSDDCDGNVEGTPGRITATKASCRTEFLSAQGDARFPPVRAVRQGGRFGLSRIGDPQRQTAIASCGRPLAHGNTMSASTSRTFRSCAPICAATRKHDALEHRMHRGVPLHDQSHKRHRARPHRTPVGP